MMRKGFAALLLTGGLALGLSTVASAAPAPLKTTKNVLAGVNFNDGPGSSDMTLIFRLLVDDVIVVDEGSAMKWIVPTAEIAGWQTAEFDDSGWQSGEGGIGFADNDDNTSIPAGSHVSISRYTFDLPNAASATSVKLLVDYDDGYVAYLNGVEVGRAAALADGGAVAGTVPPWDYGADAARVGNHGSSEMAAGKPNEARWANGAIETITVDFTPPSTTAVNAKGKLAGTWATLKAKF